MGFIEAKKEILFSAMKTDYKRFGKTELDSMGILFKQNFINSLSGYKSVNLVGTVNKDKIPNLAIFNSIFHVGSNPPLIGMLSRPAVVPRHTLLNIKDIGYYTLNHIKPHFFSRAHQTAAKYNDNQSEFDVVGLKHFFSDDFPAPYVHESSVKIGLQLVEEYTVKSNGTVLIIGEVVEVILPGKAILSDGLIDLGFTETITGSGLDTYYTTSKIARLSHPRIDKDLDIIG